MSTPTGAGTAPNYSGITGNAPTIDLADAYEFCGRLARTHYENFNVGGWITPRVKLPHVYAIYAWCRMVDDLGDETNPDSGLAQSAPEGFINPAVSQHRLAQLEWWESELRLMYSGRPTHPISVAVQHTVQKFEIPQDPFRRLIHANRLDQGPGRFDTLDDVTEYCTYSANPVGHLFLYLFGYSDPERQRLADRTCTALQLTNFWQDVSRDYHDRGRIYLPRQDMAQFGVAESDIASANASSEFRALLSHECAYARRLFQEGAPLVGSLDRKARLPVALFTRGGVAVLDAIHHRNYDVLTQRPYLSKGKKAWLLASAWFCSRVGLGYGLPSR